MYVCMYATTTIMDASVTLSMYLSVSKVFDDDTLKMLLHNNLELK